MMIGDVLKRTHAVISPWINSNYKDSIEKSAFLEGNVNIEICFRSLLTSEKTGQRFVVSGAVKPVILPDLWFYLSILYMADEFADVQVRQDLDIACIEKIKAILIFSV